MVVVGGMAAPLLLNLSQRLSLRDPVAVTRVKTLVAGSVNVAVAMVMGNQWPAAIPLGGALATGFLGYGASIVLHLVALRHIGTARQAAYLATAPFIGAVASVPILGERLTWKEAGAGWMMAAGVTVLSHQHGQGMPPEPQSHLHRHEPLAHDHPHQPDPHHRHRH